MSDHYELLGDDFFMLKNAEPTRTKRCFLEFVVVMLIQVTGFRFPDIRFSISWVAHVPCMCSIVCGNVQDASAGFGGDIARNYPP
jgi:hypothetical protein